MLPLHAAGPAHFHHVHLNTTDPAAAIDFYTARFASEKKAYGKQDAVWTQKSWLLFNKVKAAPPSAIESAVWHIGWGAEKMKDEYERQLKLGTKFDTPITDISDLASFPGFFYAYVAGPDGILIELNTAAHHNFGHLHLFSEDPIAAGEFYEKYFNAKSRRAANRPPSREPRFYKGFQVGPSASLMSDNVNIIIFPAGYLGKDRRPFVSSKGRVVDHVAFSVSDVAAKVKELRCRRVVLISGLHSVDRDNAKK